MLSKNIGRLWIEDAFFSLADQLEKEDETERLFLSQGLIAR